MTITLPENLALSNPGFKATFDTACIKVAEFWDRKIYNHYTNHDIYHSARIINIISSLLTGTSVVLSDAEKFILLTAIALHDVGMQTPYNSDLGDSPSDKDKRKALEKIRDNHHIYSERLIKESVTKPDEKFSFGLNDQRDYVDVIALIAKNHRETDISNLHDFSYNGNKIRKKLLSALIRLGDALDLDSRRVNIEILKVFPIPVDSKSHWYAHYYVSGSSVEKQKVDICVIFPESYKNSPFEACFKERVKGGIVRQINEVYNILDEYGIRMHKDVTWNPEYSDTKHPMPPDLEQYILNEKEPTGFEEQNHFKGASATGAKKTTGALLHNLPDINEFFTGRIDFLEKIHRHFQTEKKPLRLTISGFGGVGKTQTAIAYADRYKNDYDDILWVDAEGSIERYYRDFAQSKGLPSDEKVGWSVVLNAVKNWFDKNPRFLLIFDNVEDFDKLSGCLPRENGHVLITTRESNSPFGKLEVLDEFKREEALEFLKERLGRDEGENAANLAEQLGYLPLALAQAAAYIFVNKSRVNCEAYLKLLDDEGLEMFNKDDAKDYRYKATVNVTWQISIDKIETKGAKQLFNLCAYMAPDNIPLSLFIEGQDKLPEELRTALGKEASRIDIVSELTRYSMMEEKDGKLTIHRLVQMVVREKLKKDNDTQWLAYCLEMARSVFGYKYGDRQSMEAFKRNARHIWAIAGHAEKIFKDNDKSQEKIGWLYNVAGFGYLHSGQYDEAFTWFKKALEIVEKVLGKDHPSTATTYNNIAAVLDNQGKYDEAFTWFKKTLEIKERELGKDHPSTATTYNNIAGVLDNQGKYDEALALYQKALVIREKVLGKDHADTATTYNNIAWVYKNQGKYDEALAWYQKALEIFEKVLGKDHPSTATTYNNIAGVYKNQGKYDEALALYEKARVIREKALGKDHPSTVTTYNNIAGVFYIQGKYEEALALYQKALVIREKVLGKEHPHTAEMYNNIAWVYYDQDKYDEALAWYEKALEIFEKVLGKDHPSTAMTYNNIASVYMKQGKYDEALAWYQKDLNITEKVLGKDHPDTATTYINIAAVLDDQGKYDEALNLYQKALEIFENVLGKDHLYAVFIYFGIALVFDKLGQREKAEEWRQKATGEKVNVNA